MSTILDALKKSEQERKLNELPTLADMPAPEEASRWPLFVGVIIALLLLILVWLLLEARQAATPANDSNDIVLSNETVGAGTSIDASDEIVINVISWSEQAEQRFVMINGRMFREDEFVRAGLKVIEITEQGVILNERGRRIVRKP